MLRSGIWAALFICLFFHATGAHGFNFDSYPPGNLDEVLSLPKPKSGMDIFPYKKMNLKVTLESYAKPKCPVAGLIQMTITMLPTIFPEGFISTIAMAKCITVKSLKGKSVTVAIQDKVADFLPKEVPLGTELNIYCVLLGASAEAPLILVNEFQAPEPTGQKKISYILSPNQ